MSLYTDSYSTIFHQPFTSVHFFIEFINEQVYCLSLICTQTGAVIHIVDINTEWTAVHKQNML